MESETESQIFREPVSLDFLTDETRIYQYLGGHRYSTDDVLVGAYAASLGLEPKRALDLGSGVGTVALLLLGKWKALPVKSIEAQEASVELARASRKLNGMESRWEITLGDLREVNGVPVGVSFHEKFDLITSSPPYFPLGTGVLPNHPQKQACRFELRGDVSDYLARGVKHLTSDGLLLGVFPWKQADRVHTAAKREGLFVRHFRPVVLKEGEEPLLWVYALGLDTSVLPGSGQSITIRDRAGKVTEEYQRLKEQVGVN